MTVVFDFIFILKLFISNAFLNFNIIEYYIIYLCLIIETKLLI